MLPDNLNIAEITEARRKAIQKTIRPLAPDELKTVEAEIFPYDDAWKARFSEFVQANSGSSFYHATTHDQVHIIYCHTKEKGIWYLPGTGLGLLQEKGLKIMKTIVEKI